MAPKSSHIVYLAMGSNLGEPLRSLREAATQLQALSPVPMRFSAPWLTTPFDCPDGSPEFANAVAQLSLPAHWTPESLLDHCQGMERQCGRRPKKVLNEARPLDLDLIAFGQEIRTSSRLTLPHPRAHQRFFVLAPLAELAPELVLPGHEQAIQTYLEGCSPDPAARRLDSFDWTPQAAGPKSTGEADIVS